MASKRPPTLNRFAALREKFGIKPDRKSVDSDINAVTNYNETSINATIKSTQKHIEELDGLKVLLTQRDYRKDADIINDHGKLSDDIIKHKEELERLTSKLKDLDLENKKLKKDKEDFDVALKNNTNMIENIKQINEMLEDLKSFL